MQAGAQEQRSVKTCDPTMYKHLNTFPLLLKIQERTHGPRDERTVRDCKTLNANMKQGPFIRGINASSNVNAQHSAVGLPGSRNMVPA